LLLSFARSGDIPLLSIDQYKDHDNTADGTFQQFYYENKNHVKGSKPSSVILVIGSESPNLKKAGENDFYSVLADKFNSIVLILQHRYFGKSFPTEILTTENLQKYLNVHQALEDLAEFRRQYAEANSLNDVPWLISGGSYPGLLSAVSRNIHPELFNAAISSSGVVYPIRDFTDFDLQDAISMGQECAAIARKTRYEIEELLKTDKDWIKSKFGVNIEKYDLTDAQFMNFIGEIFTLGLQYDNLSTICGPLTDAYMKGESTVTALARYATTWFKENQATPDEYSTNYRKEKNSGPESSSRAWFWMTCNELAWWQTYGTRTSLRGPSVTVDIFEDQCKDVFGIEMHPNVTKFYETYPDIVQKTTHVFYSTASQDPWTWACATEDDEINPESIARTYTGNEMGHHRDLSAARDDDSVDLLRVRQEIINNVEQWLFKKEEL
jgi:hypothetical protein